jgi:hypothetical protein
MTLETLAHGERSSPPSTARRYVCRQLIAAPLNFFKIQRLRAAPAKFLSIHFTQNRSTEKRVFGRVCAAYCDAPPLRAAAVSRRLLVYEIAGRDMHSPAPMARDFFRLQSNAAPRPARLHKPEKTSIQGFRLRRNPGSACRGRLSPSLSAPSTPKRRILRRARPARATWYHFKWSISKRLPHTGQTPIRPPCREWDA